MRADLVVVATRRRGDALNMAKVKIMLILSMVLILRMPSALAGALTHALLRVGGPRVRQAVEKGLKQGIMDSFPGGVQDLLAYLHRHREDEIKQEFGCMALMIMCRENTENRRIAGEQGAIQAVVDALNRHRENKEVQRDGQLALVIMCEDNTENRRIAGEQGAIQTVVDALNRHRGNREVQANGHMALASMCINNTENRRIVDAYGQTVSYSPQPPFARPER